MVLLKCFNYDDHHDRMNHRCEGMEDHFDPAHQIGEFDHIAMVSTKGFTKEKDRHELMLSICSPGIFAGIERHLRRSWL